MACSNQKHTVVVIFEHCHYKKLCNEYFFSFFICIKQIPCININSLPWGPRYLQIRWCCFSFLGRFSVLI